MRQVIGLLTIAQKASADIQQPDFFFSNIRKLQIEDGFHLIRFTYKIHTANVM